MDPLVQMRTNLSVNFDSGNGRDPYIEYAILLVRTRIVCIDVASLQDVISLHRYKMDPLVQMRTNLSVNFDSGNGRDPYIEYAILLVRIRIVCIDVASLQDVISLHRYKMDPLVQMGTNLSVNFDSGNGRDPYIEYVILLVRIRIVCIDVD